MAFFASCGDDEDDGAGDEARGGGATGGTGGSTSKGGGTSKGGNASGGDSSSSGGDSSSSGGDASGGEAGAGPVASLSECAVDDGMCIFRHDTFGDEQLWTDTLRLHELVQTLTPTAALGVGLKVDAEAVPADVLAEADLEDPATTVALLELDAVVGVNAIVEDGVVTRIGITCALCHSTVDDSAMPGIGARLDGWPNRDLDPGAIIALTPGAGALAEALEVPAEDALAALNSWGPGYYDARFNQDKMSAPVLIPPAYGLADVELETYTGDGPVSYWNNYVAVTQMGGVGSFEDERIGVSIEADPDLVTPKLPALAEYQFSLMTPEPEEGSFDADMAADGQALFEGDAQCSTCHAGPTYTDAPTLHDPADVGQDDLHASRSATGMYRSTPLRGLALHPPYFHDGSAETLEDVVDHYDALLELNLTPMQAADLVEYLKSL